MVKSNKSSHNASQAPPSDGGKGKQSNRMAAAFRMLPKTQKELKSLNNRRKELLQDELALCTAFCDKKGKDCRASGEQHGAARMCADRWRRMTTDPKKLDETRSHMRKLLKGDKGKPAG